MRKSRSKARNRAEYLGRVAVGSRPDLALFTHAGDTGREKAPGAFADVACSGEVNGSAADPRGCSEAGEGNGTSTVVSLGAVEAEELSNGLGGKVVHGECSGRASAAYAYVPCQDRS